MFEIKSTKNASVDGVKILLFGSSGVGKTTQLGTMEGKTLILSAESGLLVLKDKDVDVIDITDISTIGQVYKALKNGELKYDNVAIDSLSEIGDMIVSELEADEYYGNPSNTFKLWGEYSKTLVKICKLFRDLKGINVIFTALKESAEENGIVKYMPQVPAKKAQSKLASLFDEVYYLTTDSDGERIIHTNETSMYVAKSRAGIQDGVKITNEVNLGTILKSIN